MGLQSLKGYQKNQEAKEARRAEAEANKLDWLKILDKESVLIRPLQELDEDSPNYSEKNGRGFIATEHVHPDNFRVKALCTGDEGEPCVGCEQHKAGNKNNPDYKGAWKQKAKLYLNVLVDDGKEKTVKVLSQGTSDKSVTPTLIGYAEDNGTITDRWFKVSRKGAEFNNTSYTIIAKDPTDDINVEDYEVQDLHRAVRDIPYEEQEAHFGLGAVAKPAESEDRPSPSVDDGEAW